MVIPILTNLLFQYFVTNMCYKTATTYFDWFKLKARYSFKKPRARANSHGSYMQPQFINEPSRQILINGIRPSHNLYISISSRFFCLSKCRFNAVSNKEK